MEGEFIRQVGIGEVWGPTGVVASAFDFDELVVADTGSRRLHVFSSTGDLLATVGEGVLAGVAVHGSSVMAVDSMTMTVTVVL
jgi:hypothetical protein